MNALLAILTLSPVLAFAQAGNPDSTFGTNGRKVIVPRGFMSRLLEKGTCLVKQDADHLLYAYPAATPIGDAMAVMRTDAEGNLYSAFGTNGIATFNFGGPVAANRPTSLAVIGDKIYVGGLAGGDMGIARLTASGQLDNAFSQDGKTTLDFGGTDETPCTIVASASPSDRIWIAGTSDSSWCLARLNLDGSQDTGFDTDGKLTLPSYSGRMGGAWFDPNGFLVYMAGHARVLSSSRFSLNVIRLNVSNNSVSADGATTGLGHNLCHAVVFEPNQSRFYLAGEAQNVQGRTMGVVASYRIGVGWDGGFGSSGIAAWAPPGSSAAFYAVKLRAPSNGFTQVLAAGLTEQGANETAVIVRMDQNGNPDVLFGTGGYRQFPFNQDRERLSDLELMGTRLAERIVAVGPATDGLLWTMTKNNTYYRTRPGWFPVQSPTRANLRFAGGTGNFGVVILGDSGKFYHLAKQEDLVSNPHFYSYHAFNVSAGTLRLNAYKSAASPTDFWVVGDSGFVAGSGQDGRHNSYIVRQVPTRQRLNGIMGGSQDAYIVGDSGLLLASPAGAPWAKLYTGTRQRLNRIFGSIIVGDSGIILKTDNNQTWVRKPSGTTRNLYGLGSIGAGAYIAVGQGGIILRSADNGDTWAQMPSPTTEDLYAYSTGYQNFICGANGTILKLDATQTWRRQESGVSVALRSVHADGFQEAICVGDNGTVLRTLDGGTLVANKPGQSDRHPGLAVYPNPAQGRATAAFGVERPGRASLVMQDLSGRVIRTLLQEDMPAGDFELPIVLDVPAGCYLVRLETGGQVQVRKLVVE